MIARISVVVGLSSLLLGFSVKPYTWAVLSVPFVVNPSTPDVSAPSVVTALQQAASAWHDQTGSAFRFIYGGTTADAVNTMNRKNVVFFRPETGGSTIAVCYWWTDSQNHLIDADIKFFDADHRFFGGTTGCTQGHYILDIATHELGHALGMNHSSVSGATMAATTSPCNTNWRSLSSDDIAGIRTLYPLQVAPPLPPVGVTVSR